MELETLEVILDVNLERIKTKMTQVMPQFNAIMDKLEGTATSKMDKAEKAMDVSDGTDKIVKQLEKMNQNVAKQMEKMQKISEQGSAGIGPSMSKGFKSTRTRVNKDVDAIVKDINTKMGQAKAQQEKLALLKAQRGGALQQGDASGVVKFDTQIAQAQAAMVKYQTAAQTLARNMSKEFIQLPKQMDAITASMAQNEARIEKMRSSLKGMQTTYQDQKKPVGTFATGFKDSVDTKASLKTSIAMDKQTAIMDKLIAENDKLQAAYAATQDRARALSPVVGKLNTDLGDSGSYTKAKENVKSIGKNFNSSGNKLAKFGSLFVGLRNRMSKSGPQMNKPMNAMSKTLSSFVRRLVIAGAAYRAFAGVASYMGKAVLANDEFSKSLNQVKVNLATAFFPIYQAIMPALNSMMAWLAKATAYLATFIATLFGTTYTAAKKGANSLNENIAAMDGTGKQADKAKEKVKKFQNVLAGFDELNTISFGDDKEDPVLEPDKPANGIDFSIPEPKVPTWVNSFADKFKALLKDLFAPMKAAWDKYGKLVMDSWKYALGEVGGLLKAIGKSFMDVWTNGSGELLVGNLLILLSDVLFIIGDIAKAFKDAWNDEGRGTALIQSIFDAFNNILELLHSMASAFREAWNNGNGESIAANLLEIFTNIFNTIGNIADGLEEAWNANDNGYRMFDSILGLTDDILGHINDMTAATEEWADKLDFTPLLTSIADTFEKIRPVIDKIGGGLSWLYENILLPIAKWAIENALPVAIDAIGETFRLLDGILEAAKPLLLWLWENFLKPIGKWVGKKLVEELEAVRDTIGFLADVVENPKKAFSGMKDSIVEKAGELQTGITGIWESMKSTTKTKWEELVAKIKENSGKSAKDVKVDFDSIKVNSSNAFGAVLETVKKTFPDVANKISTATTTAKTKLSENWDSAKKTTSEKFNAIKTSTNEAFTNVANKIGEKTTSAYNSASNKWNDLKNNTSSRWGEIKASTVEAWENVKNNVSTKASTMKNNAVSAWSTMKSRTGEYMDGIKDNARKGFDQVVSWATGLGGKISDGLRKGIDGVKKAAKSMAQGLVDALGKGVNGTIKGVNWVLDKVGADKKLAEWKVPEYAKGTNRHPGGSAIVNDAPGSTYQEAYELPNGQRGLFPKVRNMMVDLPRNTKVLSAAKTAKEKMPHYKNGIGDWLSEKWNKTKEVAGDVWDYMKKPEELAKNAIGKFTDLSKAKDPGLSIAKGAISSAKSGVVQMIKDAFSADEMGGVNFEGLTKTSDFGYRIHPITGKRKLHGGVDYGGGQGIGHPIHAQVAGKVTAAGPSGNGFGTLVKTSKGVYDYIYAHLSKALVDKGDSVKAGQKIGLMGNTGASTGPHVHYEVRKNGEAVNPFGDAGGGMDSPQGSGVNRWTGTIKKALAKNGLPTNAAYTNAWLRQVQSESGGNEKAVQGNIGDINNKTGDLAKGLLQTISATFNAYKHNGHGNIFKGYDNALAAINYAKNRYGSSKMLGVIGHGHGYENGGLINKQHMAMVGEGNKEEMIIPLTKPRRAMDLIGQALDFMGMDMANLQMPDAVLETNRNNFASTSGSSDSDSVENDMSTMLERMTQAVTSAIMMTSTANNGNDQSTGPIEITMEVDGDKIGKIAIKGINKEIKKTGKVPLNL